MKITECSGKRYDLAIELFLERKDTLLYEGVLFINNGDTLEVNSYSELEFDRTTEEMAKEKIQSSKQILKDLSSKSAQFKDAVSNLAKEYVFCFDYQTGAVMLANEVNNVFTWYK